MNRSRNQTHLLNVCSIRQYTEYKQNFSGFIRRISALFVFDTRCQKYLLNMARWISLTGNSTIFLLLRTSVFMMSGCLSRKMSTIINKWRIKSSYCIWTFSTARRISWFCVTTWNKYLKPATLPKGVVIRKIVLIMFKFYCKKLNTKLLSNFLVFFQK